MKFETLYHPPHRPDLVSSDFYPYGTLKGPGEITDLQMMTK
jgi:hypothetical protein